MKLDKLYYRIEIPSIFITLLFLHFTIMYKRQWLFSLGASLVKSPPMRFFEFPFGGAIGIPYVVLLLIVPISTGLLPVKDITELTQNHSLLMYFLLCGGKLFIILTMSVLDVYPVNTFGTKYALQRLIEITKDLLKFFNRLIAVLIGSVLAGFAFGKLDLKPHEIYLIIYGIVGLIFGASGVFGVELPNCFTNSPSWRTWKNKIWKGRGSGLKQQSTPMLTTAQVESCLTVKSSC